MAIAPGSSTVGFVGTGVMGRSMAGHLLDAGYDLIVFTRTKAKADDLVERGARWAATVAELATASDVVITMVGYPTDVEAVYLGEEGLIAHARPGALLIDMTTSTPALAARIDEEALASGVRVLDAPVSGGDIGARDAKLTIMVGGDPDSFADAEPLLRVMGPNVVHQGPAGSGQHTKMSNQIAIAGTMIGVCEAMAYAQHAGLDPEQVLRSIGAGSAGSWTLTNLAPRMLAGDFEPGFYVKHFIKDMRIALTAAHEMRLSTPGLELVLAQYERLAEEFEGADQGTQALFRLYAE
jgi:3-hydroxyisobutyrate dehydrogenase